MGATIYRNKPNPKKPNPDEIQSDVRLFPLGSVERAEGKRVRS